MNQDADEAARGQRLQARVVLRTALLMHPEEFYGLAMRRCAELLLRTAESIGSGGLPGDAAALRRSLRPLFVINIGCQHVLKVREETLASIAILEVPAQEKDAIRAIAMDYYAAFAATFELDDAAEQLRRRREINSAVPRSASEKLPFLLMAPEAFASDEVVPCLAKLVATAIQVRQWQSDNGRWPTSMGEMGRVLHPYEGSHNGAEFRLRVDGACVILYAVGQDRADDDGRGSLLDLDAIKPFASARGRDCAIRVMPARAPRER